MVFVYKYEICQYLFILFILLNLGLNQGCSSEDDSELKKSKVAKDLTEADSLEAPLIFLDLENNSTATNQTTVNLNLSGSDAVGVTGYLISSNSVSPSLMSSEWQSVSSQSNFRKTLSSTVGPTDQKYTFYGWLRDAEEIIGEGQYQHTL